MLTWPRVKACVFRQEALGFRSQPDSVDPLSKTIRADISLGCREVVHVRIAAQAAA